MGRRARHPEYRPSPDAMFEIEPGLAQPDREQRPEVAGLWRLDEGRVRASIRSGAPSGDRCAVDVRLELVRRRERPDAQAATTADAMNDDPATA